MDREFGKPRTSQSLSPRLAEGVVGFSQKRGLFAHGKCWSRCELALSCFGGKHRDSGWFSWRLLVLPLPWSGFSCASSHEGSLGCHLGGAGAAHVSLRSQAQRWRNENYERPVDLEGSGDDDPFGEDELDDVYSGSGSGYFEPELGLDTAVSLTTDTLTAKPTTIRRFLPPLATKAATTRATTLETPTTPVPESSTPTEVATSRLVPSSTARPRALPKPSTSRTAELPEKSTALPPAATTLPPTEAPQMEPGEVTTVPDNELEVPASSGPSGDFEIREEEETTRPSLRNEVVAVVTPPAGPGPGRNVETGLMDNTIDSGNSAAQLPQKNILERKEVLIAVIVGGVVGALFAAFLVMLLIYRMKKKDEGSYTLEEPKQANVTYQKPDKQEEFYA
ncbi:PREDICTED: syndecan-3 [Corvus brachyrhynchos]|uniref:syndecan-3 n=1 Tax=Corvus brachyrhynchos TaxID=85066 RepID=UPI0008166E1F|nr:PREDICTED: syndecan-3 [Corvus brachyrhynchos]